jgi:Protein of unknown function (DUF3617)
VRTIVIGLMLLSTAAWAQTKFQPLNVKPGLWESTVTTTTNGQMPISAELLNRLSPEQRAKFEERMKAQSGSRTRNTTTKNCETRKKLEEEPFSDQKECKQTILKSTSSQAEVKMECHFGEVTTTGTMNIVAVSAESVKGSGHMRSSGGGHTIDVTTSFNAKWLGSSCGNVK